jgi:transcriptional regulator with XRE-family HTH domain
MYTIILVLRESYKYTVNQVATQLSLKDNEYLELESGQVQPTIKQAEILGTLYHVKSEYFISYGPSMVNYFIGTNSHNKSILYPTTYSDQYNELDKLLYEELKNSYGEVIKGKDEVIKGKDEIIKELKAQQKTNMKKENG